MKNLKVTFYTLSSLTFLIFLYVRYENILNGYLLMIPFLLCLILLIVISIVSIIHKKGVSILIKEWIFFGFLILLAIMLINFV
jgi:hypothetical protein